MQDKDFSMRRRPRESLDDVQHEHVKAAGHLLSRLVLQIPCEAIGAGISFDRRLINQLPGQIIKAEGYGGRAGQGDFPMDGLPSLGPVGVNRPSGLGAAGGGGGGSRRDGRSESK